LLEVLAEARREHFRKEANVSYKRKLEEAERSDTISPDQPLLIARRGLQFKKLGSSALIRSSWYVFAFAAFSSRTLDTYTGTDLR
jgi:hypothetical protein